jgi:5-deoxy-glucuronate isomerase
VKEIKRHYRPNLASIYRHHIRPEEAGWKYLSFAVLALTSGQTFVENTDDQEIVIVPLIGHAAVSYQGETHTVGRRDLFRELTNIVYLPPHTDYQITAPLPLELAIGRAPASGRLPPRLIRREEMAALIRGDANVKRGVNVLLDSDELTERLTVYEIRTPSGNWSSFPPHRHDTRENSSYHEETYYYRLTPSDGFALQRIYTGDTDLDATIAIRDEDLVLIHEGYHPVVNAPGTNAYYLNFLAGAERKIKAVNDPRCDWVTKQWDGNPIPIPVRDMVDVPTKDR